MLEPYGDRLDLRRLRQVMMVARMRSITRAAAALSLTQPALSRSIQSVEALVGAPLFERSQSGVEPTHIGMAFIRMAEEILRQIGVIESNMRLVIAGETGHIALGIGPTTAAITLSALVERLAAAYPSLKTLIRVDTHQELHRQLKAGEIDFLIAAITHRDPAIEYEWLADTRGGYFVRPGHPLLARDSISAAELSAYPLIGLEASASIDPARYSPTIACNIYLGVAEVIARTDAVWLSVAPLGHLADGRRLMPLPVSAEQALPEVGIMLGRLPGRELPPSAGHVIGVLRDVLERS